MNKGNAKQRLAHETKEFLVVFLLVAPFFISFATYRTYVVGESGNEHFIYATALVNALVLSKIILIGDLARLGKSSENRSLIVSTIHKALVFTLFYLAFDVLESIVGGLLHGQTLLRAVHATAATEKGRLLSRAVVIFFAFMPLFALMEIRRVLGADKFRTLFLGKREPPPPSDELGKHAAA